MLLNRNRQESTSTFGDVRSDAPIHSPPPMSQSEHGQPVHEAGVQASQRLTVSSVFVFLMIFLIPTIELTQSEHHPFSDIYDCQ
jgi:hypothetical protein